MKLFSSIAKIAMMAVVAVGVASCGDDPKAEAEITGLREGNTAFMEIRNGQGVDITNAYPNLEVMSTFLKTVRPAEITYCGKVNSVTDVAMPADTVWTTSAPIVENGGYLVRVTAYDPDFNANMSYMMRVFVSGVDTDNPAHPISLEIRGRK